MYETITTNIMVLNVKESVAFYKEKLGFVTIVEVPNEQGELNFAIIQKDKISIMLQSKESLTEEYPTLDTEKIQPMFTLFIVVQDIEQLYDSLQEKVTFAHKMHETFYGKKEFAIFDFDHNILTFSSNS